MTRIQKTDSAARKRAIATVITVVLIGTFVVALFERSQITIATWLLDNADTLENNRGIVVVGVAILCAPLLVSGIHIFFLGSRVVRAQRFPPPGHAVIRDTKIIEGRAAVMRGRFLQSMSIVLVASVAAGILLVVYLINYFTSAS